MTPEPLPIGSGGKPVAEGGRIFISYRRQETSHLAGRLYDRLADRFGEARVFMDVDTMKLGAKWRKEIFRELATCRVLLAVISPGWLTAADGRGGRRLHDPDDIVRLEIEAALTRDVLVIPVLVEGAAMPAPQDLPESLTGLTEFNALPIRHESFRYDTDRLVTALSRELTLLFLSTVRKLELGSGSFHEMGTASPPEASRV
jgi:TIR domain